MWKIILESLQKIDYIIWLLTLIFFLWSAIILWWDITNSFIWASWIIALMFLIWFSIELILDGLKNFKWVWKITWLITNWPETLVLIVWLIKWNMLFAASTPLWSNVINPILLLIWIWITWRFFILKSFKYKKFFTIWFILTALFSVIFFQIPENYYIYWVLISFLISVYLLNRKFKEKKIVSKIENVNKLYLPFWITMLIISWFFLDPIVNFTAEASLAPKWIIWFLVLSTLTSWSEFKSVIGLLKRNMMLDAFENILVSNITNLWLAIIWVVVWMII